jgi:hypothetical protein
MGKRAVLVFAVAVVLLSLNSEVEGQFHWDSLADFESGRGFWMQLRRSWNAIG